MVLEAGKSKMINVLANLVSGETFLMSLLRRTQILSNQGPHPHGLINPKTRQNVL